MGYPLTWIEFFGIVVVTGLFMIPYWMWARREMSKRRNEWFEKLGER